ncbi:MAG: preprotein translocase subunit SecF [Candidatus Woesearchaeota archaeon]|nr:preprotein translocase subunit SecF [Candidatus Woesearchaeota archaeon]MDN5327420.1 preprotein translocase subunit SecF [Candidatus Woesearchaeota archaeon]
MNSIKRIYRDHYKPLLLITIFLLIFAIGQITYQTLTTGDFIHKGVSLKGGFTVTVYPDSRIDLDKVIELFKSYFPKEDIDIKKIQSSESPYAFIIETTLDSSQGEQLVSYLKKEFGNFDYSTSYLGPSLGESFFQQTVKALIFAFILMAIVVFLYFKVPVPSFAVVLSAFTDLIVMLSIVNLLGIKVSKAGMAAFLMLIGYSVDTDILLTTRVLKNKKGSVFERVIDAMKTGLTMSFTTIIVVTLAYFLTNSLDIKQIMLILFIGLCVDLLSTWIQNAAILRMYAEKNETKA